MSKSDNPRISSKCSQWLNLHLFKCIILYNLRENEKQRNKVTLAKFNHKKNTEFYKKPTWNFQTSFTIDLASFPCSIVVNRLCKRNTWLDYRWTNVILSVFIKRRGVRNSPTVRSSTTSLYMNKGDRLSEEYHSQRPMLSTTQKDNTILMEWNLKLACINILFDVGFGSFKCLHFHTK